MVSLMQAGAAIDDERLAGDEVAVGRGEEGDGTDEILRPLHPLQRPRASGRLPVLDQRVVGVLLRERAAGRDAVDADIVLADLHRERLGEADDAGLAGDVMDARGRALDRRARADVDYLAVALMWHLRDDLSSFEPSAAQVDRHHAVPLRRIDLVERRA